VLLIYNHGHDNVRVIHLGTLVHSVWDEGHRGKQTFPIVFDGRNDKRTCGVEGGLLLLTGSAAQACLLLDARGVHVPLLTLDSGLDAVLILEGCEDFRLGMIVNLAPKPGGMTGETVDLNSRNRGITIERLVGERSNEIIDCNESHATVGEVVSIGKPQKLLMSTKGSGPACEQARRSLRRVDLSIAPSRPVRAIRMPLHAPGGAVEWVAGLGGVAWCHGTGGCVARNVLAALRGGGEHVLASFCGSGRTG